MLRAGTTDWPPEVTSVGAGLTCTCARTWPILLRCDGQHELLFSGHDDRSLQHNFRITRRVGTRTSSQQFHPEPCSGVETFSCEAASRESANSCLQGAPPTLRSAELPSGMPSHGIVKLPLVRVPMRGHSDSLDQGVFVSAKELNDIDAVANLVFLGCCGDDLLNTWADGQTGIPKSSQNLLSCGAPSGTTSFNSFSAT